MKLAILQSNYIPWKGYFDLINSVDVFIFYDEVQYTKNDWRNRNKIYTKNGEQWLTIPVAASAVKGKISEVVLQPENWQQQHFKSLQLGYKSAPYYSQLEELINDFLVEKKWTSLKELNQYLIKKIAASIGIKTKFEDATQYDLTGDRVSRLLNLILQSGATTYITGPSAHDYLKDHENLFREKNIELIYKSYPTYKSYKQLHKPFLNAVSIVDMIANLRYDEILNYIRP